MKKKLLALKKEFIPYYLVYMSQSPKPGFKTIKTTSDLKVIKLRTKKEYANSKLVTFESFVKEALDI